jgi:hypothetical protein
MVSSINGYNSDVSFSLWGHPKEHVYALLLRIIEDIVAILHAAVINAGARMLRHVRGNAVRSAVICFELDYCNNEVSMV